MGLSRRKFTKEFKEAAVRRVEMGIPVAEVARACEVNPNVLRRWLRELRQFAAPRSLQYRPANRSGVGKPLHGLFRQVALATSPAAQRARSAHVVRLCRPVP